MFLGQIRSWLAWSIGAFGMGALVALAAATADAPEVSNGPAASDPAASPAAGCADARPEWLWCDDFEQDRTGRYFEYVNPSGSFTRERGAGRGGSIGMRARWTRGQVDAGSLKLVFGRNPLGSRRLADAGRADYRELYWRIYVRSQAGWQPIGNDKFTRAIVFAGPAWQEAAIAHVWGGGAGSALDHYVLDPATGIDGRGALVTTQYNDFAHLAWLGAVTGVTPLLGDAAGQWHCVEAHMRLNDPGSSNGVFALWVDDRLDAQRDGVNWVGTYHAYGINALFLESYINTGAPAAQVRDYDDLAVSTARIGCGVR
jgi:hypothetical protein